MSPVCTPASAPVEVFPGHFVELEVPFFALPHGHVVIVRRASSSVASASPTCSMAFERAPSADLAVPPKG
jgi:hypothetical protein